MSHIKLSSRNLLNLVLFIVVITLVLVVVYKPGKEDEETRQLTTLDKNLVTEITIERTGNKKIQFKKVGNQWNMVTPYNLKANSIKLESLLDLVLENAARADDHPRPDQRFDHLASPSSSTSSWNTSPGKVWISTAVPRREKRINASSSARER